jgi:hypothetical protein
MRHPEEGVEMKTKQWTIQEIGTDEAATANGDPVMFDTRDFAAHWAGVHGLSSRDYRIVELDTITIPELQAEIRTR